MDCFCGRNWAEDPIQGNSDLWVITSNVLRRRAVSGCLSDSISHTQSSATHSLCLNCPICFRHNAQSVSLPLSAAVVETEREPHTCELIHTHKVLLCCSQTSTHSPHHFYFPLPLRHSQTNLHLNSPTVGCTFCSITSFPVAEC